MIVALLLIAQAVFPVPPDDSGPGHWSGCLPTRELSCMQRWIPDDKADVMYPENPSCPDGYKVQRYHAAEPDPFKPQTTQYRQPKPAGWDDLDASEHHDGDLRCYRPPIVKK